MHVKPSMRCGGLKYQRNLGFVSDQSHLHHNLTYLVPISDSSSQCNGQLFIIGHVLLCAFVIQCYPPLACLLRFQVDVQDLCGEIEQFASDYVLSIVYRGRFCGSGRLDCDVSSIDELDLGISFRISFELGHLLDLLGPGSTRLGGCAWFFPTRKHATLLRFCFRARFVTGFDSP